jgi:hypothetical protein
MEGQDACTCEDEANRTSDCDEPHCFRSDRGTVGAVGAVNVWCGVEYAADVAVFSMQ